MYMYMYMYMFRPQRFPSGLGALLPEPVGLFVGLDVGLEIEAQGPGFWNVSLGLGGCD